MNVETLKAGIKAERNISSIKGLIGCVEAAVDLGDMHGSISLSMDTIDEIRALVLNDLNAKLVAEKTAFAAL